VLLVSSDGEMIDIRFIYNMRHMKTQFSVLERVLTSLGPEVRDH
jgi:hypothetical protein